MKNIAVIGGGNSGEREISLKSQVNVIKSIDTQRFNPFKVILTGKEFRCYFEDDSWELINLNDFTVQKGEEKITFDFVYDIIHGNPGENGCLNGYLDILGIPYNNSSVAISSLTFNKALTKSLLKGIEGVLVANSLIFTEDNVDFELIESKIGFPCFIKPNKGGSSVGIGVAKNASELEERIENCFREDDELMVEQYIKGTEITCGVVDFNGEIRSIGITEIVFQSEFFDYKAKYLDESTQEITPARIDESIYKHCEEVSANIYKTLDCKSTIRIDYIIQNGDLYFIELNTIPGMSNESIVPKMLNYSGLDFKDLVNYEIEKGLL